MAQPSPATVVARRHQMNRALFMPRFVSVDTRAADVIPGEHHASPQNISIRGGGGLEFGVGAEILVLVVTPSLIFAPVCRA